MDELRMVTRWDIMEYFREHQFDFSTLETAELVLQDQNTLNNINISSPNQGKLLEIFHHGELIVAHSHHSMAKTVFVLNIMHTALMQGKSVAFFSLEMSRSQVAAWMICSGAGVEIRNLQEKNLSDELRNRLHRSMNSICKAPLYIDDTAAITSTQLRSRCQHLIREHSLDLIVVDYLSLMSIGQTPESLNTDAGEKCCQLKAIATELNVPVIVCSLLHRDDMNPQNGMFKSPALLCNDSIGKVSDIVLYLHRTNLFFGTPLNKNTCEITVVKQPDGFQNP